MVLFRGLVSGQLLVRSRLLVDRRHSAVLDSVFTRLARFGHQALVNALLMWVCTSFETLSIAQAPRIVLHFPDALHIRVFLADGGWCLALFHLALYAGALDGDEVVLRATSRQNAVDF